MIKLRRYPVADPAAQVAIDDLVDGVNELARATPWGAGVVFEGVALTTADKEIPHRLGRIARVVRVEKQDAAQTVYVGAATATPRESVNVKATGNVTVTLFIA